jgi:hypothetical protein
MSPEAATGGDPLRWQRAWSIGIYAGPSPFSLVPVAPNPVLSAAEVSDVDAYYVADPFMVQCEAGWHMYFEVLLRASRRGVIGLACSRDARTWAYRGVVLEQAFHLSYPQVFAHDGAIYMLPETIEAGAVRLYRATRFPDRFEPVGDLLQGTYADPTIFFEGGLWWILACSTPHQNRTLNLFFSERLPGPWREHPRSPVVEDDRHLARPGGRIFRCDGKLIRLAQDCVPRYGARLQAVEITDLGRSNYAERLCRANPVLRPAAAGWNSVGMHHMDPHLLPDGTWIACVDGDTLVPAVAGGTA